MRGWLLRRLSLCVPTLIGITLVTFALSRLAPGGPLSALLDPQAGHALTPEQIARTEALLGLDRPLPVQYGSWLWRCARFDFGDSLLADRRPVRELIGDALAVSLPLQGAALVLMYLFGVPLGVLCAARAGTRFERAVGAGLFLLHSTPLLLTGTVLIALFCTGPDALLPMLGLATPGYVAPTRLDAWRDLLRHALLPVCCLTLAGLAGVTRYTRVGLLESLRQPYIQAARARGLTARRVLFKHALKNGILPAVTLLGQLLPWLVGGSVFVETLFGIPGIGLLSANSIVARDYPTVMALSVLVGGVTMASFFVTDLLYVLFRRRIELS